MVFTNVFNPRSEIGRMDELHPTLVRRGANLGAYCPIICGVTIGQYAFIGAGVVVKDVPDYTLVVGNPGRIVGWMCMWQLDLLRGRGGTWHVPGLPAGIPEVGPGGIAAMNVPLLNLRAQIDPADCGGQIRLVTL